MDDRDVTVDEHTIEAVSALRDELAVLSVYVDARDPEVRSGLDRVRADARALDRALESRLDQLEGELDRLVQPREQGLGRALFAGVRSGSLVRVASPVPFVNDVRIDERAVVLPLLEVAEAARPAGVVLVTADSVRVLEWTPGVTEELGRDELDLRTEEWRDMRGPAPAHPKEAAQAATATRSGQQRDLFEQRLEEHRARFLLEAAAGVAAAARARGWDVVLIAGDPRHTAGPARQLSRNGRRTVTTDEQLEWLGSAELASRAAGTFAHERESAQRELVERIRDAALSGGRGVLGADDCATTARAGRVERLVVDPSLARAEDLVRLAREHGGRVVLASGTARELLAELGGAASLLRW
jgi:phosphoserine phosphatase